jgi:protein O-GlcNAc transferase
LILIKSRTSFGANLLEPKGKNNSQRRIGSVYRIFMHYRLMMGIMPSDSKHHTRQGTVHHRAGDLKAAKADYQTALDAAPDDAETWHLLGQLLHSEGDSGAAISHIRQALELDSGLAGAAFNLAVLYDQTGDGRQAEDQYQAHLAAEPADSAALFALARLQHRRDGGELAAETYRRLLDIDADHLGGRINLGACLNELGRPEDAIAQLQIALSAAEDVGALNNMGIANQALGRNEAARGYLARAHGAEPGNPVIAANLARTGLRLGEYDASLGVLKSALKVAPAGGALRALNALALPYIADNTDMLSNARARMEAEIGRLENLDAPIENPLTDVGMTNFQAVYHGLDDRPLQEALAAFYARNCPELTFIAPHCEGSARSGGKTRIGFASAHLGSHTIGKLNHRLIAGLSRDKFDVHVFALGGSEPDAGPDTTVHALPTNLAGARAAIAEARPDILYYPDIGMEPMSYFLGYARLAPVQCVTWGHPVTTGLPEMDYFLSNKMAEPDGAQAYYSEPLILSERLDVCYARPAALDNIKSRDALGLSANAHLYLCAQSLFKVHPSMDATFAQILDQDPKAEILFIDGQQESWSAALKSRFQITIPDAGRIRFISRLSGAAFAHLIAAADVLLDTFPFSGGNTSFEALAQGKPVVTLPGAYFGGRFSYALLRQMDVLDTVADDAGDYARIAVQLAGDVDQRRQLKDRILEAGDAIFETRDFIGEREALFEELLAPS